MFKPIVQELIDEGVDVQFLDIDSEPEEFKSKRIATVPTLIFENDGIEYERASGLIPKSQIKEILNFNNA